MNPPPLGEQPQHTPTPIDPNDTGTWPQWLINCAEELGATELPTMSHFVNVTSCEVARAHILGRVMLKHIPASSPHPSLVSQVEKLRGALQGIAEGARELSSMHGGSEYVMRRMIALEKVAREALNAPLPCRSGRSEEGGGPDMKTLEELLTKCTPGPYFVAHDSGQKAKDFLAHSGSGLAIVDTGRSEDWPIARFCEWPSAELIARCNPETLALVIETLEDGAKQFKRGCFPITPTPHAEKCRTALNALNGISP